MKIYPRDPDLSTIYNRIKDGTIDLQPDFQRDLVWNLPKKQSLIDTILREWHFPPVFLVVPSTGETLDVLDGQQRLNAIFEFIENKFVVDGKIEPTDGNIIKLDGLRYIDLPPEIKSRFGRYSIRVCELTDYKEEEPYELFFRLNQGTILTPAEKRNTLYGPIREQIRNLVAYMESIGLSVEKIGFNNNRLSYQDVLSRIIYALKTRDLSKKITDQMLVDLFRSGQGVSNDVFFQARSALDSLLQSIDKKVKFNKSTLLTWLLFFSFEGENRDLLSKFESIRIQLRDGLIKDSYLTFLFTLYQEKSASSVNDAVPVRLRLLIVYLVGIHVNMRFSTEVGRKSKIVYELFFNTIEYSEDRLIQLMSESNWGLA